MGRLIIIEGGDGSGKATQTALLQERLVAEGYAVKAVSFPNYDSPAAMPVKMYLAGDFGKNPSDVNPFVASSLYAIDRFASFRMEWQTFYEEGGIILADRYTTSNMVHQMVKYEEAVARREFLDWLEDFEFVKFGLPRPDLVCLLDMPLAASEALMRDRKHKTGGATGDIHERDHEYLVRVHAAYDELVARYDWQRIACTDEAYSLRSIEAIHEDVYEKVSAVLATL
ncbi:dTMP kinase [Veillonella criceti]|uniref:Thymidylate kinase n=1 Tax=Veillonella criceti TaxID=103891 RepID=A0A380NGG2_9FIRM|nr:thymidylate kinase [Veillonella criceti]SUP40115.1 Thymidylate kinase [Veillonella criceti]